jgi:hypothetical protein
MAALKSSRYRLFVAACVTYGLAAPVGATGFDILGCTTREREALTPTDPLDCQWREGAFESSLTQLYHQGWRLLDAEYFDDDQPVFYLERPRSSGERTPEDEESVPIAPE